MTIWTQRTKTGVMPIAGLLADRFGNRPFMALGTALQGIGRARSELSRLL